MRPTPSLPSRNVRVEEEDLVREHVRSREHGTLGEVRHRSVFRRSVKPTPSST